MGRSILPEVRTAVVAGIKAALNDPKVSVTYAWQGGDDTRHREQVFTNNARSSHDPASMRAGRNYRNEDMTFDLIVLVLGIGLKPEAADVRAFEIGQVVEEFIADHKSNQLGIAGLNWIRMAEMTATNRIGAQGTGSVSEITYSVRYSARLT